MAAGQASNCARGPPPPVPLPSQTARGEEENFDRTSFLPGKGAPGTSRCPPSRTFDRPAAV
jgi:hypothetical protein